MLGNIKLRFAGTKYVVALIPESEVDLRYKKFIATLLIH